MDGDFAGEVPRFQRQPLGSREEILGERLACLPLARRGGGEFLAGPLVLNKRATLAFTERRIGSVRSNSVRARTPSSSKRMGPATSFGVIIRDRGFLDSAEAVLEFLPAGVAFGAEGGSDLAAVSAASVGAADPPAPVASAGIADSEVSVSELCGEP